ncbi:ArsA-related P-loop ATPase, partial [Planktothrix sp.]|uniref:ArsA family ATPase n=1 Tax=Planktothrix sp. TaxID=3088171 RepID=UPI0038D3AE4F
FSKTYNADDVDDFLVNMKSELTEGKQLLQDANFTLCLIVAIAEPMSLLETERLLNSLHHLNIPCGSLFINRILTDPNQNLDRYSEQQQLLDKFLKIPGQDAIFTLPQQSTEPLGCEALDQIISQIQILEKVEFIPPPPIQWPQKILPSVNDFIDEKRQLIIIGGKGGVGKTTVAAAIGWALANRHPDQNIRIISIDPAHSLGDAFGEKL